MKKYRDLGIYIIAGIVFVIIGYINNSPKNLWDWLSIFDTSSAVSLAILAFFAYLEYTKQEDDITFAFEIIDGNLKNKLTFKEYLGYELKEKRKHVNRAEVLGLLGMIKPKSTHRYDYDSNLIKDLMENISKVVEGKEDEVIIPITKEDFEKYFKKDNE